MKIDYTNKDGNKRYYNNLLAANCACESVPAGRMDSELRAIGLENLVDGVHLRKSDRVENHVKKRAIALRQADFALEAYKEGLQNSGYDSVKTLQVIEYLKETSPVDVDKVRFVDIGFLRQRFVDWKSANRKFHSKKNDPTIFNNYSNSTKLMKNYFCVFQRVHGIDVYDVQEMIRDFNDLRKV